MYSAVAYTRQVTFYKVPQKQGNVYLVWLHHNRRKVGCTEIASRPIDNQLFVQDDEEGEGDVEALQGGPPDPLPHWHQLPN